MANYYDRVLEDFDLREGILDEGILDEGIFDEGSYDEGAYDEALSNRKRRPVRFPSSVGKSANFGRTVPSGATRDYVSKSELRSSLNSISTQVNDLKKSSLALAASIKRVDDGYERVVKSIARKDRNQDSLASSTTMMTLMSTLVNKPKLDANALEVVQDPNKAPYIRVKDNQNPIQVDLTKTLLFTMMPSMMGGSGGSSDSGMMMMLIMVLLLNNDDNNTGSRNNDNTLLLMLPLIAMTNKNNSGK